MKRLIKFSPRWMSGVHRFGIVLLGLCLIPLSVCLGQSIDTGFWDHSNPENDQIIDHSDWQVILDGYLMTDDPSGIHLFDYAGLQGDSSERQRLRDYINHLQQLDPRPYSKDVQMAYWINLYNALTVRVIVDNYPIESILEIHHGDNPGTGPWKETVTTIAGVDLSLDNIEHDILRPIWQDPRIHYGVNCASLGCPNLASEVFTKSNLERLLNQCAKDFVNHVRAIELLDESFGVTSSLYYWYIEDFGNSEDGIFEHITIFADEDLAKQLVDFDGTLDHEYDWRLNEVESQ
ncbi:MAG: DUF547 domain-containing protein [Bacteroidetes bacterium]|nr:DUF547 domain-containing protein [Bacteroidota bacterium]